MARRDPEKTARNREANLIGERLSAMLGDALSFTKCKSVHVLNAKIGGKYEELVGVKERCVRTSEEFKAHYLGGLRRRVLKMLPPYRQESAYYTLACWYQDSKLLREYIELFLERTFLRHYDELARVKPPGDAELWIGENGADYGLLITPRFNQESGEWENDKSEIRKLKANYYTVGHVLASGLVVPGKPEKFTFTVVEDYLRFFVDVLVRGARSSHQDGMASRYAEFVRQSDDPLRVPLLIPELRFLGRSKKHKYRLDFCVVDPFTLAKTGFELSPWSSHGKLSGIRGKSVKAINAQAQGNRAEELRKLADYFDRHEIRVVVLTDEELAEPDQAFGAIERYLRPESRSQHLLSYERERLINTDLDAEFETED